MSTITDFMSKDHDRLDALFHEFQTIKKSNVDKAKTLFSEFKIGLQRHIIWEEEILFPIFEEKTGMKGGGPTAVMRTEHRQIKQSLENIHDRIAKKDTATDEFESGLLGTLKPHNDKEENILYPWIDNSVGEKERQEILVKMETLPEEKYHHCYES